MHTADFSLWNFTVDPFIAKTTMLKLTHKYGHHYRKPGIEQDEKSQQVSIAENRSYC